MALGGGGNNPPSDGDVSERLYRRGAGYRGRLGGKSAWESEGERSNSEADGRESAEGGAALDSDGLERTIEDAMKVADVDHLQDVGRLAHERDPEKYPYTHLTSLTTANYVAGNPLYDILHDGRTTFDGPPLLSLKSLGGVRPVVGTAVTEWKTDMPALTSTGASYAAIFEPLTTFTGELPNLQDGRVMFRDSNLTSWNVDLPSLTTAVWMFRGGTQLTEWRGSLASLEDGDSMFFGCEQLTSFSTDSLSCLKNGYMMFYRCRLTSFSCALPSLTNGNRFCENSKLDLQSVRTIADTIKDNSGMASPPTLTLGIAKVLKGQVDTELDLIRQKGWVVDARYNA